MADDIPAGFSLKRWSRRKLEAGRSPRAPSAPPPRTGPAAPIGEPAAIAALPVQSVAAGAPLSNARNTASARQEGAAGEVSAPELPPVASLSFESDFTAFLQPQVDEGVRRQALKKLFSDPHFNVMDGLDIYIDDYSKPDPISAELIRDMVQSRYIFDPPQTRLNAEGFVEDVPPEEMAAQTDSTDDADSAAAPDVGTALPVTGSDSAAAPDGATALPVTGSEPVAVISEAQPPNPGADVPESKPTAS